MNKTIIININGIVFHIEEDAYEVLRAYMSDIKRHFAYSADHEEIVADIENRLAEMFTDRLGAENRQVIILNDVQEITAQMGSVADFEIDDENTYPNAGIEKKLFRDTDDRMLAGVCSGMGHYLNIEARWVRLFMLLIVFIGGSGIMVYIILWIIMPAARTRSDKMAMKGEPVNLQNFKRTFDEELEGVRQGISRAHHQARPALNQMGNSLLDGTKVLLKVLGLILIFMESMILLALVIGVTVVVGFWTTNEIGPVPPVIAPEFRSPLVIGIFLAISIPLISLILIEIRLLFNRKLLGRAGIFIMLVLWLGGIGLSAYYGAKTGLQFTEEATVTQESNLKSMPVYFLKLNSAKYLTREDSIRYHMAPSSYKGRSRINTGNRNFEYLKNIRIVIEKSAGPQVTLTSDFSSRGADFENALKSANSITYGFNQKDSLLYFDQSIQIGKSLFRDQQVKLALYVPENTKLIIDADLNRYIWEHNLWECMPEGSPNKASEWIMTQSGLKCLDDSVRNK